MDKQLATMFSKIEQIEGSARAFEPMLVTLQAKLERLVAQHALQLWKVQALVNEKKQEKNVSRAMADASLEKANLLTKLGNQLAYTSGVQSEHLLRLLFQLDSVMGSEKIRSRRKKVVMYLKSLMGRFDSIRARALNLEPVYIKRILHKVSHLSSPAPPSSGSPTESGERPASASDMVDQTDEEEAEPTEPTEPVTSVGSTTEMVMMQETDSGDGHVDDRQKQKEQDNEGEEDDEEENEEDDEEEDEEDEEDEGQEQAIPADPLWDRVHALRKLRPELEAGLDLSHRSLHDGILLQDLRAGLQPDTVHVKVDPVKRTCHIYGLKPVVTYRNVVERRNEPRYDMFGNLWGYEPQRYVTRKPIRTTQWFSQTLQLPKSIDLGRVDHAVTRDGGLQVLLPYSQDSILVAKRRAREEDLAHRLRGFPGAFGWF
jgi:ribosomal protein L12E/L44/L45/RPP1/RPP2